MCRLSQAVVLLAGCLLALSPAVAQDTKCPENVSGKQESTAHRQKPYIAPAPVPRTFAPRDLPSVSEIEAERAMRAAEVVSEVPTGARGWVRGAVAIAVIPGVKKGAFVFGARWGKGLLTMRDQDGNWIPPSFIQIGGGNFGLQAGFQNSDLVLIFTDEAAVRSLLTGKLTLNADAAAAAPVIGRNAVAGTPILLKGGIYSYSRSNGIFAGVSLDGSVITIDGTSNARVYGKYISGDAILLDRAVRSNEVVAPFLNAMQQVSPGPNASQPPAN